MVHDTHRSVDTHGGRFSGHESNEAPTCAAMGVNLKNVPLSERSQSPKSTLWVTRSPECPEQTTPEGRRGDPVAAGPKSVVVMASQLREHTRTAKHSLSTSRHMARSFYLDKAVPPKTQSGRLEGRPGEPLLTGPLGAGGTSGESVTPFPGGGSRCTERCVPVTSHRNWAPPQDSLLGVSRGFWTRLLAHLQGCWRL